MKPITLHGLLAVFSLTILFSLMLGDFSATQTKVPVIFGLNGTLTPFLHQNWTHYELLKRDDTYQKALRDGQDYVNKLDGVREQSPWSTIEDLKVR